MYYHQQHEHTYIRRLRIVMIMQFFDRYQKGQKDLILIISRHSFFQAAVASQIASS